MSDSPTQDKAEKGFIAQMKETLCQTIHGEINK
jgi:hypothetical protein